MHLARHNRELLSGDGVSREWRRSEKKVTAQSEQKLDSLTTFCTVRGVDKARLHNLAAFERSRYRESNASSSRTDLFVA
jgi:hypothetical protein